MKKLIYIFGTAAVLGFSGCESFLDEPQPQQSLPSDNAFNTVADLESALIGMYNAGQDSDMFGTQTTMCPEIMADNGTWRGSFPSYVDVFNLQVVADNPEITGMWEHGYEVINHANLILEAIPAVDDPDLTQDVSNRIRGEALFMRGATHFEMVRFFGKAFGESSGSDLGIPVITTAVATTDDITFPSRNTVAEVYNQAIADLEEAASLLPESNARGQANRYAALAYLAEIAFQQRDYPSAASLAQQVIDGPFSLTPEPVDFFVNEGSSEEIWAYIHTVQDNPGVNGSLPTFHHVNGRGGDVVVSEDLFQNGFGKIITPAQQSAIDAEGLTAVDLRFTQLTSTQEGAAEINIEKYEDFNTNADDAPIHRLAQFLLMRAEALARTDGINDESLALLNAVRTRALRAVGADGTVDPKSDELVSFEAGDFASADELIEAIILERRVELTFEGNRAFDLQRLRRNIKGKAWDDPLVTWPVPQRDLDANSNLVQNPGY